MSWKAVSSYGTEEKRILIDHDKTLHRKHSYAIEYPFAFCKRPIIDGITRVVQKAASRACGGKEFFVW